MRFNRKCSCLFDNLLWYTVYLLPLILVIYKVDYSFADLPTILVELVPSTSTLYVMLTSIFSTVGLSFLSDTVLLYFSYFMGCVLVHLIVDVILYIFRVLHNLLGRSLND